MGWIVNQLSGEVLAHKFIPPGHSKLVGAMSGGD